MFVVLCGPEDQLTSSFCAQFSSGTEPLYSSEMSRFTGWLLQIEENVSAQIQAEEFARCKAQLVQAASTPSGERLYAEAVVSGGEQLGKLTLLLER